MKSASSVTGILAVQGDYQKHSQMLDRIGESWLEIKAAPDFDKIDRLIIPGGESTVFADLIVRLGLQSALTQFIQTKPAWGTCAGMVLLAKRVNDDSIETLGRIDIDVDRNGYGRQVHSAVVSSNFSVNGSSHKIDMVFIRAPRVTRIGEQVKQLMFRDKDPVLMSQGNILVSSFHPELTDSTILHHYFIHDFVQ